MDFVSHRDAITLVFLVGVLFKDSFFRTPRLRLRTDTHPSSNETDYEGHARARRSAPSNFSNLFFKLTPPVAEKPPREPSAQITRWQGIINGSGFFARYEMLATRRDFLLASPGKGRHNIVRSLKKIKNSRRTTLFSRASVVEKPCKFCRQLIPRRASKCPHCGEYQSFTKHFMHPTFFVTFVSMVVSIYSAKLAYTYKVDASDALREANVAKEQVIQQKELIKLWVNALDTVNIKDPEQGIKYTKKILEKEEHWLAYDMQGSAYKSLAKKYNDEDKKGELLTKALAAFKRSSELNNSSRSAIEVANLYAYFNEEEKCKEWLKKAQKYNQLPTYDSVSKCEWLFKYSNRPWFNEIKWKVYE
jgi:hypothetical protein